MYFSNCINLKKGKPSGSITCVGKVTASVFYRIFHCQHFISVIKGATPPTPCQCLSVIISHYKYADIHLEIIVVKDAFVMYFSVFVYLSRYVFTQFRTHDLSDKTFKSSHFISVYYYLSSTCSFIKGCGEQIIVQK